MKPLPLEFKVWDIPNKMFLKEFQTDHGQWVWGREKDLVGQSTFKWILDHPEDFKVLLFSGYHDKNDTKIWQGDIVKVLKTDGEAIKFVCEFGLFSKDMMTNKGRYYTGSGFYFSRGESVFLANNNAIEGEVIGNIYESLHMLD